MSRHRIHALLLVLVVLGFALLLRAGRITEAVRLAWVGEIPPPPVRATQRPSRPPAALPVAQREPVSAPVMSIGPLDRTTARALVALPGGRFLVGADGNTNAIAIVDELGRVARAVVLNRGFDVVTANAAGEILVIGSSLEQGYGRVGVARFDPSLNLLSSHVYDCPAGVRVLPRAAVATGDGVTVAGDTLAEEHTGAVVIRIDRDGLIAGATSLEVSGSETLNAIVATPDGGVMAGGDHEGSPWVAKLRSDGRVEWNRRFVAEGEIQSIIPDGEEGVLLAGVTVGEKRQWGGLLASLKGDGTVRWSRRIDGLSNASQLVRTSAGDLLLVGRTLSNMLAITELSAAGVSRRHREFRPGGFSLQGTGNRPHLLRAGDRILFAPPMTKPGLQPGTAVFVFSYPPAGDCPWFTEGSSTSEALLLSHESVGVDPLPVRLADRGPWLQAVPLGLATAAESCGVSGKAPRSVVIASKTSAFRGAVEESEAAVRWSELFQQKQFAKLEEIAASLRGGRHSWDPMRWDIHAFYGSFCCKVSDEERFEILLEWIRTRPDSITARIALVDYYHDVAWNRRGGGYANTVTERGWKEMSAFAARGWEELEKLGERAEGDPVYWSKRLTYAGAHGKGDVREVLRAAAAKHSDPQLFHTAAGYLLPKWGGSVEEYMEFAGEAARLTRATYGDAVYMWLAHQTPFMVEEAELPPFRFDWSRIAAGMRDAIRLAPSWVPTWHRYALLAEKHGDRPLARQLFRRQELDWYEQAEGMWRDRATFEEVRVWALHEPAHPFVEGIGPAGPALDRGIPAPSPRLPWPPVLLTGRLPLGKQVVRPAAFLLATPAGVVAVSAAPPPRIGNANASSVASVRAALPGWTMWSPDHPERKASVSGLAREPSDAEQRGLALTLAPPNGLSVTPLAPPPSGYRPDTGGRVFVLMCAGGADPCKPVRLSGRLYSDSLPRSIILDLDDDIEPHLLAGAPVIDEDGYAIGVCTGTHMGRIPGGWLVLADFIGRVVP